jgi:hypothetical protein
MSNSQRLQKLLGGYAESVRGEFYFTIVAAKGHTEDVISILKAARFFVFYDEERDEVNASA